MPFDQRHPIYGSMGPILPIPDELGKKGKDYNYDSKTSAVKSPTHHSEASEGRTLIIEVAPVTMGKKKPLNSGSNFNKEAERIQQTEIQKVHSCYEMAELEKKLKEIEEKITAKQQAIEAASQESEEIKKKVAELNNRYIKETGDTANQGQVVLDNKCKKCFISRNEKQYKNITFDHFSEILHQEVLVYLKWLRNKLTSWHQKAERIIEEVIDTIMQTFPGATVSLTGSYYTKCFVPWSNFNFNVVAHDSHQKQIKPEEMMDRLVTEFSKKSNMLNQIK